MRRAMTLRWVSWCWLFALTLAILAVGCSGDDDDSSDDDNQSTDDDLSDDDTGEWAYTESCPDGPVFRFDPTTIPMQVPYPNDLYTVADPTTPTGLRVHIDGQTAAPMSDVTTIPLFDFAVAAVNTLDGFSTLADLYVPVGNEPDAASLPEDGAPSAQDSIVIVDIDPASPYQGELARFTWQWKDDTLHLRPWKPLHEETRYALAVTRGAKPDGGSCYRASDRMRAAAEVFGSGPAAKRATSDDEAGFAALRDLGIEPDQVLSLSVFTTQTNTAALNGARQVMDEMAAESAPVWKNWDIVAVNFDPVDHYAFADLETPIFQNEHGVWEFDANGKPIVNHWEDVEVLLSLPTDPAKQPYPLIVYGHGLGDTKESLSAEYLATDMADAGFALAGMDAVCHGPRGPIPALPPMALLCYFDFFHPLRFRDNLRETIANYMWFTRALKELESFDNIPPGGDSIADFDTENLSYLSISMGSIHGGIMSALEANIDAWVFSSAGAKLTGIAFEGPYLEVLLDIAREIDQVEPDLELEDKLWIFSGMMQHVLDGADPANYLPHAVEDPLPGLEGRQASFLQQGSSDDEVLGGMSGAYFARSAEWPEFNPFAWDVGNAHANLPYEGSGFYQYDTAEHFNLWLSGTYGDAYRTQAFHFMRTRIDNGVGEVIDALNP